MNYKIFSPKEAEEIKRHLDALNDKRLDIVVRACKSFKGTCPDATQVMARIDAETEKAITAFEASTANIGKHWHLTQNLSDADLASMFVLPLVRSGGNYKLLENTAANETPANP